jgi:hypothetical protein
MVFWGSVDGCLYYADSLVKMCYRPNARVSVVKMDAEVVQLTSSARIIFRGSVDGFLCRADSLFEILSPCGLGFVRGTSGVRQGFVRVSSGIRNTSKA